MKFMKSGITVGILLLTGMLIRGGPEALAQISTERAVIGTGGGVSSNGTLNLSATIGQAVIGPVSGTRLQVQQGFWYGSEMQETSSAVAGMKTEDQSYLLCRPNPVVDHAILYVRTATSGTTSLTLYDAIGNRVQTILNGSLTPGEIHTIDVDISTLPSGTYQVIMESDGEQTTVPVTVVR